MSSNTPRPTAMRTTMALRTMWTTAPTLPIRISLTVTATTVPTGITVSNITNTSGTINVTVQAGAAASLGANSVTLTVEDSIGRTDTGAFTVTVNEPPVVTDAKSWEQYE